MKPIPPSCLPHAAAQAARHDCQTHHAGQDGDWLADLLQQQACLDEPADEGFCAAVMCALPANADYLLAPALLPAGPAPDQEAAVSKQRVWLGAALPLLGLYGMAVAAVAMLWLALTLATIPTLEAPTRFAEPWGDLVNRVDAGVEQWLALAVVMGWLAWCFHEQEWLTGGSRRCE